MSDHYEVVFTVFLRDDTPEDVLDALRWHLGLRAEMPDAVKAAAETDPYIYPLLEPDPDSYLPGGDVASLKRQLRGTSMDGTDSYSWGLFSRNYWLDDDIGRVDTILDLLAPYAGEQGYSGFYRDEDTTELTLFVLHDGTHGIVRVS